MKKMFLVVLAVVLGFAGQRLYIQEFGYTVKQVEAELCDGKWLVYQRTDGFTSPLRCSQTPKTKVLPFWLNDDRVPPGTRFSLGDLDELCPPKTKPLEVANKLTCVAK